MDPFTSLCILSEGLRLLPSERKKDQEKKLERGIVKGESWRDKPTDGKLRGKESLIKQNNCWAQLAPMASDELNGIIR